MPPAPPDGEPDYRASLAAERTYLAYLRTGLALVAAGIALAGALPSAGAATLRRVVGVAVVVLGGVVFVAARHRFDAVQRAMREGRPLPRPTVARSTAFALVAVAALAVVIALAA